MDARHVCALVLLTCGAAALLLSALALLVLPTPYARLHALSPASSLGLPLICLALALDAGPGRAAVKLLFIGALTVFSGPLISIAIGRTIVYAGEPADRPDHPDDSGDSRGEPGEPPA